MKSLGIALEKSYADLGLGPAYKFIYDTYASKEIEKKLRVFFEKLEKCLKKAAKEL